MKFSTIIPFLIIGFGLFACVGKDGTINQLPVEKLAETIIDSDRFHQFVDSYNAFNQLRTESTLGGATPSTEEEWRLASQSLEYGIQNFKEKGHPRYESVAISWITFNKLQKELIAEVEDLGTAYSDNELTQLKEMLENEFNSQRLVISSSEALELLEQGR